MKQESISFLIDFLTGYKTKKNKKTKQIYLTYLTWKEKEKKHTGEAFEN